jgi:hypothetical protein
MRLNGIADDNGLRRGQVDTSCRPASDSSVLHASSYLVQPRSFLATYIFSTSQENFDLSHFLS